ncbi:MAG: CBS domain-containing protein [Actinobacteria bacterium]|nr:CBS domain-containing protein [Actinomycetota bacterium]
MAGRTTRAFVGRLAGTPIFDPNGDQLGRVRDVVVMLRSDGTAPRVHGLVIEVPPHRRVFLPMTRISGLDIGNVVATGLVNMRRFAPRPAESLVVAELLDRKVTVHQTGEIATVLDVGIDQTRQQDWTISKLFIRKGASGFRRRGETLTLNWDQVTGFSANRPDQPADSLLESIDDMRAADIATLLADLPFKRQLEVTQGMEDELLADVLEELPDSAQVAILAMLDDDRAADILEEMDPGDAADLLSELTPERAEELLGLVEPDDAEDLRRLLTYHERSAGGLMTTEPTILAPDDTVAEALARIRNPELPTSLAAQVFVSRQPLETPTGRFLGVVHFQRLLRELPGSLVGSLLDTDIKTVNPENGLDEVVRYFARYNLVALPVIDENDHLLGVVTVDDVVDHMLPEDWRENPATLNAATNASSITAHSEGGDSNGS